MLCCITPQVYVGPKSLHRRTQDSLGQEVGVVGDWEGVGPGEERPFDFSHRSKRRHQDTRAVVVHQLLVKVAGWKKIDIPVSVDKIGIFFREVCVCV